MAVPMFMIVSGFVYTKSFQKNNIECIDKAYQADFFLGKIVRYTVPFSIAFCIEEAAFYVTGTNHHSIAQMGYYFLRGGIGPGSFYYPIMIQFIFFFPVIYAIIRKYDFKGLFICGFMNLIFEVCKYAYDMDKECYKRLLFRYTLLIAYGCFVAMGKYKKRWKLSMICMGVGIAYKIAFEYFGFVPPITNFWTGTSLWACLYIIPLAKYIIENKFHNRIIEAIGRASYDIFLVQLVYYKGVERVYAHVQGRVVQLIVNLVICVILGLLFHIVEVPVTKTVNGWAYLLLKKANSRVDSIGK